MQMRERLLEAAESHYTAQVKKNIALLENYLDHSAGIGEHPDIVEEVIKIIDNLSAARDGIDTIEYYKKWYEE